MESRLSTAFEADRPPSLTRRTWHPTQKFHRTGGSVEMTMEAEGTTELKNLGAQLGRARGGHRAKGISRRGGGGSEKDGSDV